MSGIRSMVVGIAARFRGELRAHRTFYLVWLLWFAAFTLLVRSTLGGPDGSRYMAYVRSIVFDHDLLLMNELEHYGQHVIVTATGYSAQIANVGVIPFWLPFYLMGLLAHALNGFLGSGLGSDYAVWLDFGDWLYGLLALIVVYRWARTRFTHPVAFASTLLVAVGSSFYYYMTALAPSYHTVAALLCALYFYLWDVTRGNRSALQWFGLGLLLGLLVSIAQYHIVLAVFLVFDWRLAFPRSLLERFAGHRARWPSASRGHLIPPALLAIPGLLLPIVPQLITWGIIFGNPFTNPYTIEADWSGAHFFDVLFSSYHGLFFTAPVLVLAVCGWLAAVHSDKALAAGSFIALAGIAYSSSTRIGWWAGVSFGARYFIGLTPLFVFGLATLSTRCASLSVFGKLIAASVLALAALCVLWTYGYYLQASTGLTSFSEYHPAAQWLANQFSILQHPGDALSAYWLAERSAWLRENLGGFALCSLICGRLGESWIKTGCIATRRGWIVALALIPAAFALLLLTTIGPGEEHKQQLAASGYYEKNLARGQLDYEQFSNEYVESARYHEALGQLDAVRRDIERALAFWPGKTRRLVPDAELSGYRPLHLTFGDQIELLGYQVVGDQSPTEPTAAIACASAPAVCSVAVRLLWRAPARLPEDFDTAVLLLDTGGAIVARSSASRGVDPFPSTWWPSGMMLSDEHVLDVSDVAAPALFRVRVDVFDGRANKHLSVRDANGQSNGGAVGELKRGPGATVAATPALATLGGRISLLAKSGLLWSNGHGELSLTWRAEKPLSQDYTVFVHLLDAQNRIVAQSDSPPRGGSYPTHAWSTGDIVSDVYQFSIDRAGLANISHIAIGMYTTADGQRLPVSTGGDAIIINP
jgi:Dolichyl-phosphate-mannose-protein mannosyltransferase